MIDALCAAILSSERAGTYAASPTTVRTRAVRAPPEMLVAPLTMNCSTSSSATGVRDHAISVASTAHTASVELSNRRDGTLSTTAETSRPLMMYGRKPSANVSDDRNGDPV